MRCRRRRVRCLSRRGPRVVWRRAAAARKRRLGARSRVCSLLRAKRDDLPVQQKRPTLAHRQRARTEEAAAAGGRPHKCQQRRHLLAICAELQRDDGGEAARRPNTAASRTRSGSPTRWPPSLNKQAEADAQVRAVEVGGGGRRAVGRPFACFASRPERVRLSPVGLTRQVQACARAGGPPPRHRLPLPLPFCRRAPALCAVSHKPPHVKTSAKKK